MIISLIVWMPLLIFMFYMVEFTELKIHSLKEYFCETEDFPTACLLTTNLLPRPFYSVLLYVGVLAFVVFIVLAITLSLVKPGIKDEEIDAPAGILYLSLGAGILLSMGVLFYKLSTMGPITLAAAMLLSLFAGPSIAVGLAKFTRMNASYMLRRFFDKTSGIVVPSGLLALFVGLMPTITGLIDPTAPPVPQGESIWSAYLGTVSILSGTGTAIYGYYIKARSISPGLAGKIISTAGSIIFIYGILLFCFISGHLIGIKNIANV